MLCDYMASNEGRNVESMWKDKVWGTTNEILADAIMYNVNICVWAKFGNNLTWHNTQTK